MRHHVLFFTHIDGWSTGFGIDSDETPAQLLSRIGREGVVIDRPYRTEYYAPSQIKNIQIENEESK